METWIVTSLAGLQALGPAWQALGQALPELPHTATHEYVAAWARALPAGAELAVVVAEDHGELTGILPTALFRRTKGPLTVVELAFLHEGDQRDAVLDTRRVPANTTVKALLGAAEGLSPRRISLRYLPANSPVTHHLLRSPAHNPATRLLVEHPRILLGRYASFAEYRRTLPRSLITAANKLRRDLGMELAAISPVPAELFAELVAAHQRQQQHLNRADARAQRRSLFENPNRLQAYQDLTVDNPAAIAFVARTGAGEYLFHELAWQRGGAVTAWNTAYNPDFADHRPSRARLDAIEWLFTQEVSVFDLGAGRYPWKFELTPDFTNTYEYAAWLGSDPAAHLLRRIRP